MIHQNIIDIASWAPISLMVVAQISASDRMWVVANLAFAIYHATLTHIYSLALCSMALAGVSLWRVLRR